MNCRRAGGGGQGGAAGRLRRVDRGRRRRRAALGAPPISAHAERQADGDEQATQFQPAVRARRRSLAAPRLRPPRPSGDELAEVGALRAAHAGASADAGGGAGAARRDDARRAPPGARAVRRARRRRAALRLKYVGEKKVPSSVVLHQLHGLRRARARAGAPVPRRRPRLRPRSRCCRPPPPAVRVLASTATGRGRRRARARRGGASTTCFACGARRGLPPRRGVDLVVALHAAAGWRRRAASPPLPASALVVAALNKHRRLPAGAVGRDAARQGCCRLAESSERARAARRARRCAACQPPERDVRRLPRGWRSSFFRKAFRQNWVLCAAVDPEGRVRAVREQLAS